MKAAGVVVDDAAVTPAYVRGLAADRELPDHQADRPRLAAQQAAVHPAGGAAAQRDRADARRDHPDVRRLLPGLRGRPQGHPRPAPRRPRPRRARRPCKGRDAEAKTISGAIRTDFILSAEIMVISLKEVLDEPIVSRGVILALVGRADHRGRLRRGGPHREDGRHRSEAGRAARRRGRSASGQLLVTGMPKLLAWLSVIGTAAMLWVGGHILLVGFDELGWEWPVPPRPRPRARRRRRARHRRRARLAGQHRSPRRSSASWSASSSPPWWIACPAEGPAPTGPTEPRASSGPGPPPSVERCPSERGQR